MSRLFFGLVCDRWRTTRPSMFSKRDEIPDSCMMCMSRSLSRKTLSMVDQGFWFAVGHHSWLSDSIRSLLLSSTSICDPHAMDHSADPYLQIDQWTSLFAHLWTKTSSLDWFRQSSLRRFDQFSSDHDGLPFQISSSRSHSIIYAKQLTHDLTSMFNTVFPSEDVFTDRRLVVRLCRHRTIGQCFARDSIFRDIIGKFISSVDIDQYGHSLDLSSEIEFDLSNENSSSSVNTSIKIDAEADLSRTFTWSTSSTDIFMCHSDAFDSHGHSSSDLDFSIEVYETSPWFCFNLSLCLFHLFSSLDSSLCHFRSPIDTL